MSCKWCVQTYKVPVHTAQLAKGSKLPQWTEEKEVSEEGVEQAMKEDVGDEGEKQPYTIIMDMMRASYCQGLTTIK